MSRAGEAAIDRGLKAVELLGSRYTALHVRVVAVEPVMLGQVIGQRAAGQAPLVVNRGRRRPLAIES